MWNEWVIDATLEDKDGFLCFVPIENKGTAQETYVVGMNVLSNVQNFERGKIVGIIHEGGQEAVEKWIQEHPEIMLALKQRKEADERIN